MTSHPANTVSLVADIGGTNTRCALANGKHVLPETIRRYSNADYTGLESVLRQYLADEGDADPAAACIAVAGPVRDGAAVMTNLDWTIDNDTLSRATKAETVSILNDLQAQGYALDDLAPTAIEQELRLCQFVSTAHGFPAVEDVLSGRGLERVFAFLGQEAGDARTSEAKDIMAACADGSDHRAQEAVALFCKILGTVCGNLSLIQLPFGGVFLVGGVARAMAPYLGQFGFAEAFRDKGRFAGFMSNFAVNVVEDDYAALAGSAAYIAQVRSSA